MEGIYLAGIPPAFSNQAAVSSCIDELTRSNSESSSSITEDFKDRLEHEPNATLCECTAKRNEKQNQYLNRLEASFVMQLHQSTRWLGWCAGWSKNTKLSANQAACNASEQFTVLSDGCRQKIDFGKGTSIDSHDFLTSPWVTHFKHAEGSGQNFMDEDCEHILRSQVKKLKTSVADTSSED